MNQMTTSPPLAPADAVLALFQAVLEGDVGRAEEFVTDDVVLRVLGTHPLAGEHVGAAAIVRFVEGTRSLTDDGEHIEVLDVLTGTDHVALYCRVEATRQDRAPLVNHTVHLARLTDGRVSEINLHNRDDRPVDRFWS